MVAKSGSLIAPSLERCTFEHGLGVMPDIVIIYSPTGNSTSSGTNYVSTAVAFSEAFISKFGLTSKGFTRFSSGVIVLDQTLDNPMSVMGCIGANETSISFGNSAGGSPNNERENYWIAIGGLT